MSCSFWKLPSENKNVLTLVYWRECCWGFKGNSKREDAKLRHWKIIRINVEISGNKTQRINIHLDIEPLICLFEITINIIHQQCSVPYKDKIISKYNFMSRKPHFKCGSATFTRPCVITWWLTIVSSILSDGSNMKLNASRL